MAIVKRTLKDPNSEGRNPYSAPLSDLTIAQSLFAQWSRAKMRSAEAITRRTLACAWVALFSFMAAHCTVYWLLREKTYMLLQELPVLTIFGLLMIPLAILLPSRVYMHQCRRKIGVSAFTTKWNTYFKNVIGRPLVNSLIWILGFALIAIVWQGLAGLILIHRLSWSKDWFFALTCAIPIAFAVSFPACQFASRGISMRLSSLESAQ